MLYSQMSTEALSSAGPGTSSEQRPGGGGKPNVRSKSVNDVEETARLEQAELDRNLLTDGLMSVLRPVITELDTSVKATRNSQIQLRNQIDMLAENLRVISDNYPAPYDLDAYVKKLQESRKRVAVVGSILQNSQDRLQKLHCNVLKETERRKAQIEGVVPESPP